MVLKLSCCGSKRQVNIWKRTYCDFHIRPGFLECISRVAVDAGAWSINKGNGNVSLDLTDPLQHGSLSPAVGNGHIFKSSFSTETDRESNYVQAYATCRAVTDLCEKFLTLASVRSGGRCSQTRCCRQTQRSISAWSLTWWSGPALGLKEIIKQKHLLHPVGTLHLCNYMFVCVLT